MRVNSNHKIHKMKRDPYKTLLKTALILVVLVAVGIGVFYFCSKLVEKDYMDKRQEIETANAENEVAFNTRLSELRSNANAFMDPITGDVTSEDLPYWEKTLGDKLWRVEDEGKAALENTSVVSMSRAELLQGGLLLVNPWHPLPSDYAYDALVSVGSTSGYKIQVVDSTVRLFPAAYQGLADAMDAAAAAGMDYYIVREGYRTNEEQTTMFEKAMTDLSNDYSGDILIAKAKESVNYPGTSEYQTGLAFRMDLYSKEGAKAWGGKKYSESDQGAWLTENAWKYGLVFRFPVENFPNAAWESKTYKTGISSRMNLYRFVGKAHSAVMRLMDYCLEEYVEFLIAHPHLTVYEDGSLKYEIYRVPSNDYDATFSLPVPNPANGFQASMDNMGGIVLAYSYN